MTFLLDVSVLIALLDQTHIEHEKAHAWFEHEGKHSWATCPLTENGLLRILGNAKYPNSPGSPAVVAGIFRQFRSLAGHVFWPDGISLFDSAFTVLDRLLLSRQLTDTYLLSLAVAFGGRLATFDRRMAIEATVDGEKAFVLVR